MLISSDKQTGKLVFVIIRTNFLDVKLTTPFGMFISSLIQGKNSLQLNHDIVHWESHFLTLKPFIINVGVFIFIFWGLISIRKPF